MLGCGEEFNAPVFPSRRRVSSLGWWMANEVRQAAHRLAESFLRRWIAGGSTASCTWCSPTFPPSSTLPLFALLSLLLLCHPPHVKLGSCSNKDFKSRQSLWASKAFPDATPRTGEKWKNKCNISPVLWKGPLGCWVVGRSEQEWCSTLRGVPQEEWWDRPGCRGAR